VSAGRAEYPTLTETHTALLAAAQSVYVVPGLDIAEELGNTRTLNVVLLGALSGLADIAPDIWLAVIKKRVPAKVADINAEAFRRGRQALGESRLKSEETIR
jgi:indolepyruvate ferredoxin oxidoreductase beta subunit